LDKFVFYNPISFSIFWKFNLNYRLYNLWNKQ